MAAAESWPLVATGWLLGFAVAVAVQTTRASNPTGDVLWHAAATSAAAALTLLALIPWASPAVARGSIASLLKDR